MRPSGTCSPPGPCSSPLRFLPVVLGTGWGYRQAGEFDVTALALALAGIIVAHAGVNVLNDVYDDAVGGDRNNPGRIYPYTGGSRFIQAGIMDRVQMRRFGVALLAAAALIGLALATLSGPEVLIFGVIGLALGIAYSAPPVQLSARGWGEIAVAVGFGVLPVTGAAWLQTGIFSGHAVLISLPISCWIFNVLLMNEVPDTEADARAGKRTMVVRFEPEGTHVVYLLVNALAVLAVAIAGSLGALPAAAMIVPVLLFFVALQAARAIRASADQELVRKRGIERTLLIHAAGSLWLIGWIWA